MASHTLRILAATAVAAALVVDASAQLTWEQFPQGPGPAPAPRYGHAFAGLAMFGGRDATQAFADTWTWTGDQWVPWTVPGGGSLTTAPSARHGHAMVWTTYGPFLFGGADAQGGLNGETWRLGATWQQIPTTTAPSARHRHAMVYSPDLRVYLFGGITAAGPSNELWYFDTTSFHNQAWQLVAANVRPPARFGHALLPHANGCQLVGGADGATTFDDVWLFDGQAWHQQPNAPFAASESAAASLIFRGRAMFVGGRGAVGSASNEVHELTHDGRWWVQSTAGKLPPRADAAGMEVGVCNPHGVHSTFVLFGGRAADGTVLGDTWQLEPKNQGMTESIGTGCGAGAFGNEGPEVYVHGIQLGDITHVVARAPQAGTLMVMAAQLGVALPPSCSVTVDPQLVLAQLTEPTGSIWSTPQADFALAIPFIEAMRGQAISVQCVALDPSAPAGLAISRLGVLRLGD